MNNRSLYKFTIGVGTITWAIVLILSILFKEERIATLDNAFQTFLMICDDKIEVMADRYPAIIVRLVPFILIKLKLSLSSILTSFSISYILFHAIVFGIILFIFKNPKIALLQLAVFLLAKSTGFYWCNSEQIQGLSFLLLFFAGYQYYDKGLSKWALIKIILLSIALLFYHPLIIVPFVYLFVIHYLITNKGLKKTGIIVFSFIAFWFAKITWYSNWYDTMKSKNFNSNLKEYGNRPWDIPALHDLFGELFSKYIFLIIGFVFAAYLMIRYKKYIALIFLLLVTIGYLFIILIGEPTAAHSIYTEVNYYPFVLFFYFPIILLLQKKDWSSNAVRISIVVFFGVSIFRIVSYHSVFTDRLTWVKETMITSPCNKPIFEVSDIPPSINYLTWSIPYESLIISNQNSLIKSLHPFIPKYEKKNEYTNEKFVTEFNVLNDRYVERHGYFKSKGDYCRLMNNDK